MKGMLCAAVLLAAGGLSAGEVRFTAEPQVVAAGGGARVRFAVSEATDVEVAVLDAAGQVVRHLAAGRIGGAKAAAPLKPGLAQDLTWDGQDDAGGAVAGDPAGFKVRVRIGARPQLRRYLGRNDRTLGNIAGLAVGPGGELYVLLSEWFHGRSEIRVLDRNGEYLRTIMPYAADVPERRTASVGHLKVDGRRIPIVFNGHVGNLHPLTSGMQRQNMAFHPSGALLAVSAVGTWAEHGPPRHLLAFEPAGGAPEGMNFVGPRIRRPLNFLGGAGEASTRYFDHVAVSGDGKHIYLTTGGAGYYADKTRRHGVFRLTWSDADIGEPWLGATEAGSDAGHFNDPQGIAVDAKGHLYVCDRGNNRVRVFTAEGKPVASFAVDQPEQIAVHPRTGAIYVVSRKPGKRQMKTVLRKFTTAAGGAAKQVAELAKSTIELIAVDPTAQKPRLWASIYVRWGQPRQLLPIVDAGDAFEVGADVGRAGGFGEPTFLAVDAARNRVLVRDGYGKKKSCRAYDLTRGQRSTVPIPGTDLAVDRAGNVYVMNGYRTNSMSRFDPAGKPLPFAAVGSHTLRIGLYRGYGPDVGLRGHCVSAAGDIYVIRSNNHGYGGVAANDGTCGTIDVFGADGRLKRRGIVNGLGHGDCGVGVDASGGIYVGINVKPAAGYPLPACFEGQVPGAGWVWWRRGKRAAPWSYPYCNAYLFHLGSVVKFGAAGGKVYGFGGTPRAKKGEAAPTLSPLISAANAPADAAAFRSGYLARPIRIVGMEWAYTGVGTIPTSDVGWGDPGCVCYNSHLAVDAYGRVFAPNAFGFCVEMLDAAGNHLARVGRYGNCDGGAGEIVFARPQFVSVGGDWLCVSDSVNRRVAAIGFAYAAERLVAAAK